jgi:hypothetical protein
MSSDDFWKALDAETQARAEQLASEIEAKIDEAEKEPA